jgi:biopolymer transport protein ExbB
LAETTLAHSSPEREAEPPIPAPDEPKRINLLGLLLKGRWLMLPIGLMSLLVVAVGAERFLGLRRRKVIPSRLVAGLNRLAREPEGFDPRKAYKLCRQYPSAASTVVETMLLKVGRPLGELDHAVQQVSQREADRLHSGVRWLNLAATVSPLLGLLGTVWGMIEAFFRTATVAVEVQNRAQLLAGGIWTALVTTFAGLAVAIPAAVLAHYFEGRILRLFRDLDELVSGLSPYVERYEGRVRVTKSQLERPDPRPLAPGAQARTPRRSTSPPK